MTAGENPIRMLADLHAGDVFQSTAEDQPQQLVGDPQPAETKGAVLYDYRERVGGPVIRGWAGPRVAVILLAGPSTAVLVDLPDGKKALSIATHPAFAREATVVVCECPVCVVVEEVGRSYRWTSHRDAAGAWCWWSAVSVSDELAESADPRCPAGCVESGVEPA